jgi:hypothetical protein
MGFVCDGDLSKIFGRIDKKLSVVHDKDKSLIKLLDLDIEQGPWLAGGAVLTWLSGHPVGDSDFDIFFKDLRQFDEMFGRLMRNHASIIYTSENALTLHLTIDDDLKRIQLIRKSYFDSAKDVIDHFDFTICQLVTDGYQVIGADHTFEHLKEKRIVSVGPAKRSVVKRIVKYVSYGYTVDQTLMQSILDNPDEYDWSFNNIDENYENAF